VAQKRKQVVLDGDKAQVVFDLGGGGLTGFCLTDPGHPACGLTPLAWNNPEADQLDAREMAHFLVLDRWCKPTAAEMKNGMPFHGEAPHSHWKVIQAPSRSGKTVAVTAGVDLPLAGLSFVRTMKLSGTILHVEEKITNPKPVGRAYNMIEHVSLGPPFLDGTVLVDTKVAKGFTQEFKPRLPVPEEPAVGWPEYEYKGRQINMRTMTNHAGPLVTSYIMDEDQEYGWATACHPGKQLLIGYIWKTKDFPWLNLWRHVVRGKPKARGLEFGTTGWLQPFPMLAKKGSIFGRQLMDWIDADQTVSKKFTAFLAAVPPGYRGVADLQFDGKKIRLVEQGGQKKREVSVG
jgi:hypothetical protein